jgi:hypothetical protein
LGGTNGGFTGAGGTGKSTNEERGLEDGALVEDVLEVDDLEGEGVGSGALALTALWWLSSAATSTLAAGLDALTAGSDLTGIAGFFAGVAGAAAMAFALLGGSFAAGEGFFAGAGFAAGFGDSAFFAGATFFAPGGFEVLETGFFFAGAALEGLTAGFAFPLGEADFGVVFFTAMAQE